MSERHALRRPTERARVTRVRGDESSEASDLVAAEEPMEIRAGGPDGEFVPVSVTMRTPGNDFELAAGFLYTEGLISSGDAVVRVAYCDPPGGVQEYNVVTVWLAAPFDSARLQRHFFASSSCGICGKATIDHVETACRPPGPGPRVRADVLVELPHALRERQRVFDRTGGLHACGLFDASGALLALREDVGRHNALDKVCGWALLEGLTPLEDRVLMVSGRVSFEIVQKAAVSGVPIVCAVSAPTSLAVSAARRLGMTLVGFLREGGFNVYAGAERIVRSSAPATTS